MTLPRNMPTLQTERLLLRPFALTDASRVRQMAGSDEVYQTTQHIPHPYGEGVAEHWIASHLPAWLNNGSLTLAVTLREDRTLVGAVGLVATPAHGRAELGYWIGPDYWGEGYGTEAARAMVAYGLGTLGFHKITSRHMVSNPASGRVMQKIGMVREGTLIDEFLKDGTYHSLDVYGLINPGRKEGDE